MKRLKLLIAAALVISPFAAQADLITHTINFDGYNGSNNGTGTDGPFTYSGLGTDNSGGNCPANQAASVEPRCARLNSNDTLTFVLTVPGPFDLIDFWWRSTGEQENSDLFLEWDDGSMAFGFNTGETGPDNDTVYQPFPLIGITTLTFTNVGTAVVRIDNISFSYDDGLCNGVSCDPVPVPEPGTMVLLGFGLIAMGFARRKKIAR